MPCFMTGSAEGDAQMDADEARRQATRIARLLCSLSEELEKKGKVDLMPPAVKKWWRAHQKIDAKRIAEENRGEQKRRNKVKALKKLSSAERDALDL